MRPGLGCPVEGWGLLGLGLGLDGLLRLGLGVGVAGKTLWSGEGEQAGMERPHSYALIQRVLQLAFVGPNPRSDLDTRISD